MKPHTPEPTDETTKGLELYHQFLEKFRELEEKAPKSSLHAVVIMATAAFAAHPLMALAKAEWVSYLSLDLLLLILTSFLLWWDSHGSKNREKQSPPELGVHSKR